ncbi:MAG: hypothetical protein QNJ55_28720 [Xenococcus sp. MO_188.B8]|nr:hypothetical protein [Xenococcus sp. MO_188.B8]
MKIFLRREGGQIPTYCPQGIIETDDLPSEEANQVIDALEPERLRSLQPTSEMPDAFNYFIRLEKADGSIEEFQCQECDLDSKAQKVLHQLINKIQRSLRDC